MKILITGKNGQLAKAFLSSIKKETSYEVKAYDKKELDITDTSNLESICSEFKPNIIINTAAFTKVDLAEDPSSKNFHVNHVAISNLAFFCMKEKIFLIHFSTDYVHDGLKKTAWLESDDTNPINKYGEAKLLGENEIVKHSNNFIIFRISWVFSENSDNFLTKIMKLANENQSINVVSDQMGKPTSAYGIAKAVTKILPSLNGPMGIYNFSEFPEASWADFAEKIVYKASKIGLIKNEISINRISSKKFPTRAVRPQNSVLSTKKFQSKFGINPTSWENSLDLILNKMSNNR